MNKKKKLNGFTLIELVIVLAIFGIILAVIMSLIQPATKIMKKASVRESTASYSDNISEYLDNSLHYSSFMYVYENGFADLLGYEISEEDAVNFFVNQTFDGAVGTEDGETCIPLKGRVHVLKLLNNDTTIGSETYKAGRVLESTYDFTAREYGEIGSTTINLVNENREVINEEHFRDYTYYYNIGYATLDPISNPELYSAGEGVSFESNPREYYNQIVEKRQASGLPYSMTSSNFCINVIAYKDGNKVDATYDEDGSGPELEVNVPLFKSPAHLTAASMALPNMQKIPFAQKTTNAAGEEKIRIPSSLGSDPDSITTFRTIPRIENPEENIYIIFVSPEEIYDTTIDYANRS